MDGARNVTFFLEKKNEKHPFLKEKLETKLKPWIVIGCLLRLYLKWSFLHFHHKKKYWKLFRITGFLNEHQTLTVMWEFVMWSGSSTVVNFLVYASPGLLAHHLQQNFNICHPTPLNPFPLVTLVRNTPTKAWFNIKCLFQIGHPSDFGAFNYCGTRGTSWDTQNLRNGCLADAAACGRVLLRSQVLQLQGNLKPLAPWRGNFHTCDNLYSIHIQYTH